MQPKRAPRWTTRRSGRSSKTCCCNWGEIVESLRSLDNPRINAYCIAAFEGSGAGWLGQFERDIIEQMLRALDEEDEE